MRWWCTGHLSVEHHLLLLPNDKSIIPTSCWEGIILFSDSHDGCCEIRLPCSSQTWRELDLTDDMHVSHPCIRHTPLLPVWIPMAGTWRLPKRPFFDFLFPPSLSRVGLTCCFRERRKRRISTFNAIVSCSCEKTSPRFSVLDGVSW